jgi:hypothetical protein
VATVHAWRQCWRVGSNELFLLLLLQFNDICWRGAPHDFKGLDGVFPTGSISFAGGLQRAG